MHDIKNVNIVNNNCISSLKCLFINARGLLSKIDILRVCAMEEKLDLIGVAETFLTEDICEAEIAITGFKVFRKDRHLVKLGKGGGVVLYVKTDLIAYEHENLNKLRTESVWCKLKTKGTVEVVIGVCYKSQKADENELQNLFSAIKLASEGHVLIMGDFNCPSINWKSLDCNSQDISFRDLIMDCYLIQHVDSPTRENNILDLVMTSEVAMVSDLIVKEHLGNSDHNIITWRFVCNADKVISKQSIKLFHKAEYEEMRKWFSRIQWTKEFENLELNEMWSKFCAIVNSAVNQFVPEGSLKHKKFPKWMNKSAKVARKYKSRMWFRYRESKTYNDLVEYKRARNKAVKAYKKAKKQFEIKIAQQIKINPKSFYSYVRSKTRSKDLVGPLKDNNDEMICDNEGISNILNSFFGSVFTNEEVFDKMPEVKLRFTETENFLHNIEITSEKIMKKINMLALNKSPGIDGIVPILLKENKNYLCEPLSIIYTESLKKGIVPADWKRANVTPIFKKGPRELPCNYRPISLTSHVCKILESIIRDAILDHLKKYNLIKNTQHGFVKNKSCLTNILEFLEYVTNYIDQGLPVDVIYLDFQKAFDKVPHKRLLLKLKSLGIVGEIYGWIEDWLKEREQRVVYLGSHSEWIKVKSGVPQGSVLGPLLFLIYINDIDDNISSKILKFADDTKIFHVVDSIYNIEKIQADLVNLFNWSNEWLMLFNVEKCKVMHFGHNNINYQYVMDGKALLDVKEERDLGVIVQNDLKCGQQCIKAIKQANKVLGMIKRSFNFLNRNMLLQLYKSLVRPHLEFCIQAWNPHLRKDVDLLEKVQRRMSKMINEIKDKTYEERLKYLGLTTLETRRLRGDLIEVFKMLKGYENVDANLFFSQSNTVTRGHSLKLFKHGYRLDCRKYFFSQRVIDIWNSLSDDVIACNSVNSFKNKIDKLLNCRGFV